MGQIAHGRAAIFFFYGDTQHAQIAHLAPQVHGESVIAVDSGCARCNLGLRKVVHCGAQRIYILAKLKVQSG